MPLTSKKEKRKQDESTHDIFFFLNNLLLIHSNQVKKDHPAAMQRYLQQFQILLQRTVKYNTI